MLRRYATAVATILGAAHVAFAQSPVLRIDRDGRPSVTLTLDAIKRLSVDTVTGHASHGAPPVRYRAVKLVDILAAAGSPVDSLRLGHAAWLVVAQAKNGYVAAFTSAEIDPTLGPSRAYVAFARDGAPLDSSEGPFDLVVPTDSHASRSARMVISLRVFDPLARTTR
jgi:hypothetical protein